VDEVGGRMRNAAGNGCEQKSSLCMLLENTVNLNLEQLLKLRAIVARFGELDNARWWNTQSQLGQVGATVLRRGLPRTHRFAQARSVFAVAAHRCDEVFNPPGCVTLWKLPDEVEEAFEARWEHWLDHADDWTDFFDKVGRLRSADLLAVLREFGFADELESIKERFARTRRTAEGRAVSIDGEFDGADEDVLLLAAGFAKGDIAGLSVPYVKTGA
jgi:hypothetical protein